MATLDLLSDIDETLKVTCYFCDDADLCKRYISENHQLKLLTFNIRSIQKNLDEFLITLARISINFDVIILTECHLGSCSLIKSIPGFMHHATLNINNKAGGVVAYTRSDWNVYVNEPNIAEADSLLLELPNSQFILAIYRSPSFVSTNNFLQSLYSFTSNHSNLTNNFIVTGDININILNDDTSLGQQDDSDYLCLMAELGLQSVINLPTRDRACLDHIFVNCKMEAVGLVCSSYVTDHELIMAGISLPRCDKTPNRRVNIDYLNIAVELDKADWSDVLNTVDVNLAARSLSTVIADIIKRSSKTFSVSRRKKTIKEWITPGLIKCMVYRDTLHKTARRNPHDKNCVTKFTKYRNSFHKLLKNLKQEHNRRQFWMNKDNPACLWKTIKSVCELSRNSGCANELLRIGPTPSQSLDSCNQYFINVGRDLSNKILLKLNKTQEELAAEVRLSTLHYDSFFMSPTHPLEILKIIKGLKNRSAPGKDGLTNIILKNNVHSLLKPLTHVMNLSLSSGKFPDDWKIASVVPIHKDGPKSSPANFRPISLLPVLSKILEKLVNKRLSNYIEQNKILSAHQFGFRPGKSTEQAVHQLMDFIVTGLDCGKKCIGVFLDLAKAFDTVSPLILLCKLERLGIRGQALDFFGSYLSDRGQCVSVSGLHSSVSSLSFGVPQGSILGPTLFTLYINDIIEVLGNNESTRTLCYADDTAIIFLSDTWEEVTARAEDGLARIARWLDRNLLTLNANKTKYVCFYKTKATEPPTLSLKIHKCNNMRLDCDCATIGRVECIRYLGVLLDENISFKQHIIAVANRVRKIIHIMKLLRDGADRDILMLVYTALCQSIICYCITVWGSASKSFMITLERAQRSVIKVMFRKPFRYPTASLYSEYQILTVRQLYIMRASLEFHKSVPKTPLTDAPSRRRKNCRIPKVNTAFAKRFRFFAYPFIYSRVSKECDLSCLLYGVKVRIRKWLLTLDYDETERLLLPLI